jgi:hypothetical protein
MVNEVNHGLRLLQRGALAPTPLDRPTRRERAVNWGDRTRIQGRKSQTLAWVSLEESQPVVVYASATVRAGTAGSALCIVSIEWGHGGASVEADYAVIKRLRVPLAASMVKLSGRLIDPATGAPADAGASADVSAFIALGVDGLTLRNTRWLHQTGASGTFSAKEPQRVMRVEGFNAGGSTFVHLFDHNPGANAEPLILVPAPTGRRFRVHRFDSQGFARGLYWGASSVPLTYTADPAANVRVDVELLL